MALCRLLDSFVDVLAVSSSAAEGVDDKLRDDLMSQLDLILSGSADADDMFASHAVGQLEADKWHHEALCVLNGNLRRGGVTVIFQSCVTGELRETSCSAFTARQGQQGAGAAQDNH